MNGSTLESAREPARVLDVDHRITRVAGDRDRIQCAEGGSGDEAWLNRWTSMTQLLM